MKKVFMALISIFLIVSSSLSGYAFLDISDDNDPRNLGEIVMVNVDSYEPTTISSDYIRNQNFPVYVYLSGNTLEGVLFGDQEPGDLGTTFGDLKIKDFRIVKQGISRYVSGIQEVEPQGGYYVDSNGKLNLGYLKLYVKKIPVEENIPDVIDINLTARIQFDVDSSFGIFGRQDLFFDGNQSRRSIYEGRAELELLSVRGSKANFQLHDESGRKMGGAFDLNVGGAAKQVTINRGPSYLDNKIRIKLSSLGGIEDHVIFDIGGSYGIVKLVEGMNLYPGSDWEVAIISDPYIILYNEITKEEVIFEDKSSGEFRSVNCKNIGIIEREQVLGLFSGDREEFAKKTELEGSKDKVYCTAIDEYKKALEYATGDKRDELNFKVGLLYRELKDPVRALEYYRDISSGFEYDSKKIGDELQEVEKDIEEGKINYKMINGRRIWLQEIKSPEDKSFAQISVDGVKETYNAKDNRVLVAGTDGKPFEWRIVKITPGFVHISKFVGGKEEDKLALEMGKPYTLSRTGTLSSLVKVEYVNSPLTAVVSVLPGDGRNYGVSDFSLHLPIEKSLIQWTPEEIDSMIDKTHATVGKIDSALNKLGKFIRGLKVACFSVFSYLTVKNAFFVNNRARGKVIEEYTQVCAPWIGSRYGSTSECLKNESKYIDPMVDGMSEAMDKADKLMSELSQGKNQNELAGILGKDRAFVDALQTDEIRRYSGFSSAEMQELLSDYYYDEDRFSANLAEYGGLFSNIEKARTDLVGVGNAQQRDAILSCIFSIDCGKEGSLSGNNQIAMNHLSQTYNVNSAVRVSQVIPLDNDKYKVYLPSEGGFVEVDPVFYPESNTQIVVDGNAVYMRNNKLYYGNEGFVGTYSNTYKNPDDEVTNNYDEQNRLWVFAFSKDGLFENSGMANYVAVSYDPNSNQRTYTVLNVGNDGLIDRSFDGDDRRLLVLNTDLIGVRAGNNEDANYDFGRIYQEIDREYTNRNKQSYVGDGFKAGDFIQSKVISNTIYRPQSECISYMSQGDCDLLFGVCDPVMCPASRFNLGGRWPVDNVVQTGIIGSIVLGLPNFGPKEPLPICLTGIHAGLDNIKTKFEGFEDCLQKAKATGESVGICNTIKSVYMCEILWREGLAIFGSLGSIADLVTEKVFGKSSGGGEYLDWKKSWNHVKSSVSFFTTTYASSAFASYQARSLGEFGSEVCKAAIYGKAPGAGDFIGELLEPSSPYQFTGWFDESPYSAIENGKSVYRVYYHIYSGRDEDTHYYVYLKGPGKRDLVVTNVERGTSGGNGFIKRGEYVDKSGTLTADTGYTQMCINVNNKVSCGFGKVSSAFSSNYLNDMLVEDEMNRVIDSQVECMPDSPTLGPGLGSVPLPNDYGLVETGITRICSSYDPDGSDLRWSRVGHCGSEDIGCYIDKTTISINDLQKRDSITAQLNEANLNESARAAYQTNEDQVIKDMEEYARIVEKNIEDKDIDRLVINSGYYRLITQNNLDNVVILIEAHDKLGDIFSVLARFIEAVTEEERIKEVKEKYIDKYEAPDTVVCSDEMEIRLIADSMGDILYKWDGEKWTKSEIGNWFKKIFTLVPNRAKTSAPEIYIEAGEFSENYYEGLIKVFKEIQFEQQAAERYDYRINPDNGYGINFVMGVKIVEDGVERYIDAMELRDMSYADFSSGVTEACGFPTGQALDLSSLMKFVSLNTINNGAVDKLCSAEDLERYAIWIEKYSSKYGADPILILAQMMEESGCKQGIAPSSSDAYGLMQITEGTFDVVCKGKDGIDNFNDIKGLGNAENNIDCGIKILKYKYDAYSSGLSYDYLTGEKCKGCCKDPTVATKFSSYRDWDAALRGYVGWGCPHEDYVEEINTLYQILLSNAGSIGVNPCYVFDDRAECLAYNEGFVCMWDKNKCVPFVESGDDDVVINSCSDLSFSEDECLNYAGLNCVWANGDCFDIGSAPLISSCSDLIVQNECSEALVRHGFNCLWQGGKCLSVSSSCEDIDDLECSGRDDCFMHDGFFSDDCYNCLDLDDCEDVKDRKKCGDNPGGVSCTGLAGLSCYWDENLDFCNSY